MIFFKPQPDEIAIGYGNRLAIMNGHETLRKLTPILAHTFRSDDGSNESTPLLWLLAKAANLSRLDFAILHSMMSVLRFASISKDIENHGSSHLENSIRRFGMGFPGKHAYVCLECIKEDKAKLGFSYYRRNHQLEGVDWCLRHGSPLKVVHMKDPYSSLPHFWLQKNMLQDISTCANNLNDSPLEVQRYTEIVTSFLDLRSSLNVRLINTRLRDMAKESGFRISANGKKPLLSDILSKTFPKQWLLNGPAMEFDKKIIGEYYFRIDDILRASVFVASYKSYGLVLSVFFDSAATAIQEILSSTRNPETVEPMMRRTLGRRFWHGYELYSTYIQEKGIYSAIADKMNLERTYAAKKLMEVGLPSLMQYNYKLLWKAYRDFINEVGLVESCAQNGIEVCELEGLLRVVSRRVSAAVSEIDKGRASDKEDKSL